MDAQVKKYCPNCSQLYVLNVSHPKGNNFPLFLSCGHSMCEKCVGTIVKFGEPIECKVCHRDMAVDPSDVTELTQVKNKLYKLFPVNVHMLGELYLQHMEEKCEKQTQPAEHNCFIDLKSLLQSIDNTQGECLECHCPTSKMCQQCATILCNNCFNKIHKNFTIFRTHCLKNIGPVNESNDCKLHKGKPLDYYCQDCSKAVCMNCMMVGGANSCKNHNVDSIEQINEGFFEELSNIYPKVDETFRRLTKTAVDIGQLLYNIETETDTSKCENTKIMAALEQHFSKLDAQLHKHKQELTNVVKTYKISEKESLQKAKADVVEAIKKAKNIMNTLSSSADARLLKETNLSVLLQNAKEIVNTPWYLKRDEPKEPLQVILNETIVDTIPNYINFKGENNCVYKLCSTTDLGDTEIPPAPPMPAYPPEMPKDVRLLNKTKIENTNDKKQKPPQGGFYKNAPKYHSKSASISSLNSVSSESSQPSYRSTINKGDVNQKPAVQTVMPFPENQHRRQLHEGSQEVIYITHIVNPHNFYVQRSCHQELVKEMSREFRNAVSLPKPSLNHIGEGKVYLVYNRADNMWQRGRVVFIDRKNANKPLLHMFCIDFGSREIVTIDKVRLMPLPRLNSPAPLAMNCSLANCEPKTGTWNSDDAFLIRNIIDNKQAVIHVRHVHSTSDYTLKFDCDVTTFEDGISLAHALVFHERARMIDPKLPYPKILGCFDKPKIFANTHDLQQRSVEEVYLTHIASPDKFFVRKRHLQDVYEKLSEDLELEYGVNDDAGVIYLPEVGMVCAVNLSSVPGLAAGAAVWARGSVCELPGRGRVRVSLSDSGAVLLVHWAALRRLPHKFTVLGALAMECHLAGVTPLNKKWSPKAVALLQRFEGRLLRLRVDEARGRGSLGVTLYDDADDENIVCINTLMIKHKLAVTFGMFMFDKDNVAENVIMNKSPPRLSQRPPEREPPKFDNSQKLITAILKRPKSHNTEPIKQNKIKDEDLKAKDKGPLRLEAKILNYHSPSLIYISLTHQQKIFNDLLEKMQLYYNANKKYSPKEDWKVGDRCCVQFNQPVNEFCSSQTWRRAVIVDIKGSDAKLFFSDFACVETAPLTTLQELTAEFASIGDAAIKCHLWGVMPVGEEWPSLTKEYLKELLDAYKRVFITKMGSCSDKSMPVEIWVYHTIQGGALEPDKSEWRCLNKKIIEQGLGIPDKSQQAPVPENNGKPDDEMLSFLNITGSVTEWVRLESSTTTPIPPKFEPESHSSSPDGEELRQLEESADQTVFISDWLPPEPLLNKEFYGVPTYIDNDGFIYLHAISQQDTLDLLRKALDVRFKDPDPKAKYAKWRVGEPCIALFFLDNRFYRGRVLEVNKEASTCLIHYVDYGNEEICSFANMRKSVVLYQIPVQAHKCILNRIRPIGAQWDRQTLDYVHKSVVEKQCLVKITGDKIFDTIPIDLKYDKLWFNDHLVDFEMAVYTDGSKAVVRRYQPARSKIEYLESDSSPDFIMEEDAITPTLLSSSLQDSLKLGSMESQDWNKILDCDEDISLEGKFIRYPKYTKMEFMCNIMVIHDLNELELNIIHDDESSAVYEILYADIQKGGANTSPLNGIFENKACIALFPEDIQWYRASILQYSEVKNLIKVKYVDYGNIGVISLADVREINEKWAKLPPSTITAKLWGVKLNKELDMKVITKRYADTLLDKGPFHVKVMGYDDSIPLVELRNDNGDLIYENLLNDGIFLKK